MKNAVAGENKQSSNYKKSSSSYFSEDIDDVIKMRKKRAKTIQKLQNKRSSTVFVLWTLEELKPKDFFTLSDMLEEEKPTSDIDLIVLSHGGNGETGYRIGHTFQGWAQRNNVSFRVIIPQYAMSAATILSLGAHEIVMGLPSEIGPIDPQIPKYDNNRGEWRYIPALAVLDGLKLVSEYIQKIPDMSRFFEEIVRNENLTLTSLGLLERMRETGKQQAEALLIKGMLPEEDQAKETAARLTDYYKYHGHPIDAFEAEEDLKLKIVHCQLDEWQMVKEIRDEFQNFVGKPGIISDMVVTCAIETTSYRSWRYKPLERSREYSRIMIEKTEGIPSSEDYISV